MSPMACVPPIPETYIRRKRITGSGPSANASTGNEHKYYSYGSSDTLTSNLPLWEPSNNLLIDPGVFSRPCTTSTR